MKSNQRFIALLCTGLLFLAIFFECPTGVPEIEVYRSVDGDRCLSQV